MISSTHKLGHIKGSEARPRRSRLRVACAPLLAALLALEVSVTGATPAPAPPAPAPPAEPPPAEPPPSPDRSLELALLSAQPVAMGVGESVGAQARAALSLSPTWEAAARLSYGAVEASGEAWAAEHSEARGALSVGPRVASGRGALWVAGGVGGVWVDERRARHQAARLGGQVPSLGSSASVFALELCGEVGLTLDVYSGLSLALRGWVAYRPLPLGAQVGAVGLGQSLGALWRF